MAVRYSHLLSDGSEVSADSGLLMAHLAALARAAAAFCAGVHIFEMI